MLHAIANFTYIRYKIYGGEALGETGRQYPGEIWLAGCAIVDDYERKYVLLCEGEKVGGEPGSGTTTSTIATAQWVCILWPPQMKFSWVGDTEIFIFDKEIL